MSEISIIGTCGICGGAVTVPHFWGGLFPPTPTCSSCGARARDGYGRKIEMEPRGDIEQSSNPFTIRTAGGVK